MFPRPVGYTKIMARHRQDAVEQIPLFSRSKMEELIRALAAVGHDGIEKVEIEVLQSGIDPDKIKIPKSIVIMAKDLNVELE